jgi:hypothetical protein
MDTPATHLQPIPDQERTRTAEATRPLRRPGPCGCWRSAAPSAGSPGTAQRSSDETARPSGPSTTETVPRSCDAPRAFSCQHTALSQDRYAVAGPRSSAWSGASASTPAPCGPTSTRLGPRKGAALRTAGRRGTGGCRACGSSPSGALLPSDHRHAAGTEPASEARRPRCGRITVSTLQVAPAAATNSASAAKT